MPEIARNYPLLCPLCKHTEARPERVSTVKDTAQQVQIEMRCHECNHRWSDVIATSDKDRVA